MNPYQTKLAADLAAGAGLAGDLRRLIAKTRHLLPLKANALTGLAEDDRDNLAALSKYFESLQDLISDLFDDIAFYEHEDVRDFSQRDKANLMEKLGALPSSAKWGEAATLRNKLARAHSRIAILGVVAKVEFHFGELFPRVGFIVTNLTVKSPAVIRFYNRRGTGEQWIKEGKQAVAMTRLSRHRFRANEVRLWLSVLAYNLGNLWRRLTLPRAIGNWSLSSLQQRVVKTGGRLVKHARYYWLLLAESHLTRRLFAGMLVRIAALPAPTG